MRCVRRRYIQLDIFICIDSQVSAGSEAVDPGTSGRGDGTMAQSIPSSREARGQGDAGWPNTQFRCLCCNGVIMTLFDQDVSGGLNLEMGLVFDEYSFICDNCAATLVAERRRPSAPARRKGTSRKAG
jgi:hypothetical protein